MRNRTLWRSKKIELAFEIGLPVNKTQFSKTIITKNNTFSHKLMLLLVITNKTATGRTGAFYKIIIWI